MADGRAISISPRDSPRVKPPLPGAAQLLAAFGVTKRPRSAYDHFMLGMHDAAKADTEYQRDAPRQRIDFAPGETWIAFTDQVVHAATRGQFAFEQTCYVNVECMKDRAASPLAILERMAAGLSSARRRTRTCSSLPGVEEHRGRRRNARGVPRSLRNDHERAGLRERHRFMAAAHPTHSATPDITTTSSPAGCISQVANPR
jgi:hypothetical protein